MNTVKTVEISYKTTIFFGFQISVFQIFFQPNALVFGGDGALDSSLIPANPFPVISGKVLSMLILSHNCPKLQPPISSWYNSLDNRISGNTEREISQRY